MRAEEWLRVVREDPTPCTRFALLRALKRENQLSEWPRGEKAGRVALRRLGFGIDGKWHRPKAGPGENGRLYVECYGPNHAMFCRASWTEIRSVTGPDVCYCASNGIRFEERRGFEWPLGGPPIRVDIP